MANNDRLDWDSATGRWRSGGLGGGGVILELGGLLRGGVAV